MYNNSIYIPPGIKFYSSFDEALAADPKLDLYLSLKEGKWEFINFFDFQKTFIVAEPGYGKTRLLQEIVSKASDQKIKAIYVESKKIADLTIEEFILDQSKKSSVIKSDTFKLENKKEIVICLDALDEVKLDDFSSTGEKIKTFLAQYSKITAIISCRWHFFRKFKELFNDLGFRYARIFPFSKEQVESYLKNNAISQENIEKIFSALSFQGRDLVIQTPRYLELLVSYIRTIGTENISALTKAILFEFFIYKKLEIEDKKLNTQKRDLIKRVLEKLALIMEIYQANLIKKDELMSFFDDLQSDLKISFLQQVPIEVFFDKTILKDNIDTIEFENTEFQEYLSAKEITRLGKNIRTIFELSVDPEQREIYPSWFNTLGFVVDLDISVLKPLLDFGRMSKEGFVKDEEYHHFLTQVDTERLSIEDRMAIFEQVFTYYQSVLHWIDWDIAKNLSYYFDISQHNLIKYYANEKRYKKNKTKRTVHLGNVAQIIGFILKRGIFDDEDKAFWRRKLIKFAQDKNENDVLQRNALLALGNLRDESIIREVESIWQSKRTRIQEYYLNLCRKINPNHDLSLKYFIEGTKQKSIDARYGLYEVTKVRAIETLLDDFIHDPTLLNAFIDQERIFGDQDSKIIENIKAVWNRDIEDKLEKIVQKPFESCNYYIEENSILIKNISLLLKSKNKNYLFKLISQIATSINLTDNLFDFKNIFSILLEKEHVGEFIKQLSLVKNGRQAALWTLQQIKFSNYPGSEEIYEKGRNYLRVEYEKAEKAWKKQSKKQNMLDRTYKEFKLKLEPEKGKYSLDIFKFYIDNKKEINFLITKNEKDRLINLIEKSVFEKFDPGGQSLKITMQTESSKSYRTHTWIHIFGDCIRIAYEFNLDVTKYKKKIINYIPFAYPEHLDAIFSLVKNFQPDDIKRLVAVYREKKSDLWRFMPDSFILASERYVIRESVPILREFVKQNDFSIYDRISALNASDFLKSDPGFLKKVFKQYLNKQEKLAEKANGLLIVNHKDPDAVSWRIDELVKRAFPFKQPFGAHSVSSHENELHDKEFAAPLMKLKDTQYKKKFINLLNESFNIIKKDGYRSYAQYLWEIVHSYFDNLKEGRSYQPLRDLEKFVTLHSIDENINWFKYHLKKLKRSYITFLGKPKDINECIKKYNKLKTQQYLEIATARELYEKVYKVIDIDLRRWVEGEKPYNFIVGGKVYNAKRQDYESLIQKTIKAQIEKAFMKRGFEVNIIREPQLLNDKRTDFLIFYGLIGPILIEVKLSKSGDVAGSQKAIESKRSYKNLCQYMKGFEAHFGILLVFDNKPRNSRTEKWEVHLAKIKNAYEKIDNVAVLGLSSSLGL